MPDFLREMQYRLAEKLANEREEELAGMASTSANPDNETVLSYDDFIDAVKKVRDLERDFWQSLFDKFGLDSDEKLLYLPMWLKNETPPVPEGFDVTFTEHLEDNQLLVGPNIISDDCSCLGFPNQPLEDLKHTR